MKKNLLTGTCHNVIRGNITEICDSGCFRMVCVLALFVSAYVFWAFCYPHSMAYQEQFQLFLFDSEYLANRLVVPGGLAAYIAEFLTQFYNHSLMGATVISSLLVLLQVLSCRLAARQTASLSFPLSFLAPLTMWYVMGDENVMLAFMVSLEITLLAMLFCPIEKILKCQSGQNALCNYFLPFFVILVMIPLVYWIAGSLVFLLALYIAIRFMVMAEDRLKGLGLAILVLLYALAQVLVSGQTVPYPVSRLFFGIYYYRLPTELSAGLLLVMVMCLVPFLVSLLPSKGKTGKMVAIPLCVVIIAGSVVLIPEGYDAKKYELIEYDYLVRRQLWHKIIAKAEQNAPDLPMSVCALNLALAMTNQLGDRAFDFYQHGVEGLFPDFERNFSTSMMVGDLYFQLGLVNTSQRYSFEAMEAIPNYNKSGRATKRLAETNLINGQYNVARKYLNMLRKTVFYRKWAETRLELVDNPKQIDSHPLYGAMRKLRLQEDFLFSGTELDKICGQLLMRNKDNRMAMQYLLMSPILKGDINSFMNYYSYVETLAPYRPKACQEAVAFAYMQRRQMPPQGMVDNSVLQNANAFMQAYSNGGKNSPQMAAFKNTVWYYFLD